MTLKKQPEEQTEEVDTFHPDLLKRPIESHPRLASKLRQAGNRSRDETGKTYQFQKLGFSRQSATQVIAVWASFKFEIG
jgi:hypothetical protein